MNYTWDNDKGVYLDEDGKPVPDDKIRDWVELMIASLAILFIGRATNLAAQSFSQFYLDKWLQTMRTDIRLWHYIAASIPFGGLYNTPMDVWLWADERINFQFQRLNLFYSYLQAIGAASGALASDFISRSGMYGESPYSTFQESDRRAKQQKQGMTQERNVLGASDHCEMCMSETSKGWVQIGTLTPIGNRTCLVRCRCHYQFK